MTVRARRAVEPAADGLVAAHERAHFAPAHVERNQRRFRSELEAQRHWRHAVGRPEQPHAQRGPDLGKVARREVLRVVTLFTGQSDAAEHVAHLHVECARLVVRGHDLADVDLVLARHAAEERPPNVAFGERERRHQLLPNRVGFQVVAHRAARRGLQRGIDRGLDGVSAVHGGFACDVVEHLLDVGHDLGRELRLTVGGRREPHLRRLGEIVQVLGNEALFEHLIEHVATPGQRLGLVLARRIVLGRSDQAREQRGLGHVEILGLLAEVIARSFLDAVATLAEVDGVQIEREDLVFAELFLEAAREDRFLDLAPVGALRVEQHVLHHLLSDGATALTAVPRAQIGEQGAQHAEVIQPLVLVELCVFRGQERELGVARHLGERNHRAALDEQARQHGAVAREHARDLGRLVVRAQIVHVR